MKKLLLLLFFCLSLLGSVQAQNRLDAFANLAVLSAGARGQEYVTSSGKEKVVRQAFTERVVSLTIKVGDIDEATMQYTAIPWNKIEEFSVRPNLLEPQLARVVIEFSEVFPYQFLVGTKEYKAGKDYTIELFVLTADADKMRKYLTILQNAK